MPDSDNREGLCAECGCNNKDHEFGRCLGESIDKKTKKAVRCKFEWSQCLAATHSETGQDCLVCSKHPNDRPRSFRVKSQMKSATGKEKAKLKPRNEEIVSENGKKKKKVEEEKPDNQGDIPKKKDKTTESTEQKVPHEKDPKEYKSTSTIKEPSKSVNPKSSVAKPPKNEAGESSGDELAWDQDKAEEDALAQQMQQLSLKKARDKRPDDPDMVEWKRVRAWSKDDEVVYFRNPDTGNKQRTVLTAWTEETRKFGKVKKDCLVFYSRKDRRAFYCESFEDEEPKRDT